MPKVLENTDVIFVDLDGDPIQQPDKFYHVKHAHAVQGDGAALDGKKVDMYLTAFFAHNLPDWNKTNEGVLAVTARYDDPTEQERQSASYGHDFRVKDATAAGGFGFRRIFRNMPIGDELELGIQLTEVDKKVDISKYTGILDSTSIGEVLDISKGIPYVGLATELYDGITELFVNDDPIWDLESLVLRKHFPTGGGNALKQGHYAVVATTDVKGKKLQTWAPDYGNVFFKGKHLHIGQNDAAHLPTNYMVFELGFH